MSDTENELPYLIDRSVKRLFREQPRALLRLLGIEAASVRFEDSVLNFSELRADHVFIVEEGGERYAFLLEYQLRPDPDLLVSWGLKWLGLCQQLQMDVFLVVIYLEKGDRATFPASFACSRSGLRTALSFDTIRLWEHRARIVSGEWPELAPLLVLCEANPTEATLQQERELIRNSGLPDGERAELLGIAILLATRTFGRSVIRSIFREEMTMINMEENLKELLLETGALQLWAKDPRVSGELVAEAEAEGIAKGKVAALREMTLSYLTRQFGQLPESLVAQITTADADECQRLFDRAVSATSLAEFVATL